MRNRLNIVLVIALLIVSFLFYWQFQKGQDLEEALAAATNPIVAEVADIESPDLQQFTLSDNVDESVIPPLPPQNNEELWSGYTDEDQAIIRGFDSSHFNALTFVNEKQYEWMVRHGYPTPEEILAAAQMSTEELEARAAFGNVKAALFLADRYLAEAAALANDLTKADDPLDDDYAHLLEMAEEHGRAFARSGSAFAGYLEANLIMERKSRGPGTSLKSPVEMAFKGFAFARRRGDRTAKARAFELADSFGADVSVYYRYSGYHKFLEDVAGVGCGPEGWVRAEMMPSNRVRP